MGGGGYSWGNIEKAVENPMGKPVWKVIYKCWVFLNYVNVNRRINCMFNWEHDAKSWEFGIVWGC